MNKHLLTEIEIKNFKCFENFKADGFKKVNLIGGKNNVGKTAFMEALFLNACSESISNLLFGLSVIEKNRDILNICINDKINIIDLLTTNGSFSIDGVHKIKFTTNKTALNNDTIEIQLDKNDILNINFNEKISFDNNDKVVFISNFGFTNNDLKQVYKAVQFQDMDVFLNECIVDFDDNISQFKIISDTPYLKRTVNGEYMELSKFGDGIKHYISIISSLYASKNSYLFIDEIENGIHWTLLDKIWELILTISKEQNVQVFATTHSKECIESYARVSKKLEDEDISFISLYRDEKNNIKSVILNHQEIKDRIEFGLDNR